jgi:hypothetical protein
MALTRCRQCRGEVSTEALACPDCGTPNPPSERTPSEERAEAAQAPTAAEPLASGETPFWKPVGYTEVAVVEIDEPPSLPASHANSSFAWFLAAIPITGVFGEETVGHALTGAQPSHEQLLLAYVAISSVVAFLDAHRVAKSGRNASCISLGRWLRLMPASGDAGSRTSYPPSRVLRPPSWTRIAGCRSQRAWLWSSRTGQSALSSTGVGRTNAAPLALVFSLIQRVARSTLCGMAGRVCATWGRTRIC